MDPQYVASLEATLKQTLVADTAAIKQASTKLAKEFYSNDLALPSLFHILQNAEDDQLKQLASVEARKLVLSKWESVDSSLKPDIKNAMLHNTFNQPNKLIRHSSARVVSAIGEIDLESNQWPELLPTLIEKVQSNDLTVKEMSVFTILTLLETQMEVLMKNTEDFLNLFSGLLVDQSSREIRVNSVLAFDTLSAFIENQGTIDNNLAKKFQDSVPIIIEVLKEVIQADDIEKAKDIFNVLNSFIFIDNKLIGNYLIDLIKFNCELSANKNLDEEIRVFSLQFLISAVNIRKSKILSSNIGSDITLIALKVASEEIDIEEELDNEDEENENEENSPPSLGLRLIAMLSTELPPSQVLQPIFNNVEAMINSSNQFERRAAILSIGVSSPGAPDYMAIQINKIVPLLIKSLKDSELIVRVAGLRSLAQLTSELQDIITAFHEQFLPLLIDIIDSATSVAVYKYACSALDGLIEFLSHDSIDKYIEPLMNKLVSMLQTANTSTLRSTIVSAIGSTAYAAGKKFIPFFKESIKYLEPFLSNVASTEGLTEDDIELRALTFENISTMARAVGKDAFAEYATPLVEAAYQSLNSDHSRIRESGFAFISNMAKVYGEEFAGFLDKIVPEILKCLEQEEFTFNFDGDEEELDLEDDEDLGNKLNVNTGITYEKEVAAVALGELANGTGKDFYKYVEPSVKVLVEQVENSYGMREASMGTLFKLLKAMFVSEHGTKFKYPKGVPQSIYINPSIYELTKNIRTIAIDNLEEEYELTMVACILDNLAEIIHQFGAIAVIDTSDQETLSKLCQQLMMILTKQHPCQLEDDEEIPSDEQDSSEAETVLFDSALEVLINLSIALGKDFGKIFMSFNPVITSNVKSKSKTKRVATIGCLAEMSISLKDNNEIMNTLLELFISRLRDDISTEVKGNAAYGIGLVIENNDQDFSASYQNILELLFHLLSKADKEASNDQDDEESQDVVKRAFANACGCVARLALKNQQAIPLEHIIDPLLNHLPLKAAFEENTPIFKFILKLFESSNEIIVSKSPKIVEIFGKVFEKEFDVENLIQNSTLGREEGLDRLKQFENDELKQKIIDLLKFINQNNGGIVSNHPVLKSVI